MTDAEKPEDTKDADLIRAVWEEARDLVKRLEGSTRRALNKRPSRGSPFGLVNGPHSCRARAAASTAWCFHSRFLR